MEAQGGAEVRRLHIVYFLSRKGRIEHPHLVRVHHLSRNGVRLRDIKRWLGELRGKDMPESFAWSYKRKYKTGYVWQDLLDDDLITPISDNEYVLKGSEISSNNVINRDFSDTGKKVSMEKDESSAETAAKDSSETSMYVSTKSSSEIEEESPTFGSDTSTLTDDSGKLEPEKSSDTTKDEKDDNSSSFYSGILSKKNKKSGKKVKINDKISSSDAAPAADSSNTMTEPRLSKSKSYNSNGGSNLFRSLISCGAVDTNDSAVVVMNKQQQQQQQHNRLFLNMCSSDEKNVHSADICRRDKLGGSQRIFETPNWTQQQWNGRKSCDGVKDSIKNKGEFREQRFAGLAAYKPINGPNCSQCGKPFKPEKLHSHMKSCKGLKSCMSKNVASSSGISIAATENSSKRSTEMRIEDSVTGCVLAR